MEFTKKVGKKVGALVLATAAACDGSRLTPQETETVQDFFHRGCDIAYAYGRDMAFANLGNPAAVEKIRTDIAAANKKDETDFKQFKEEFDAQPSHVRQAILDKIWQADFHSYDSIDFFGVSDADIQVELGLEEVRKQAFEFGRAGLLGDLAPTGLSRCDFTAHSDEQKTVNEVAKELLPGVKEYNQAVSEYKLTSHVATGAGMAGAKVLLENAEAKFATSQELFQAQNPTIRQAIVDELARELQLDAKTDPALGFLQKPVEPVLKR
jgi:hypothetical protein